MATVGFKGLIAFSDKRQTRVN